MRRAKIVATMGPAVSTPERIAELVEAGLNVARLNMSHGTHADHDHSFQLIRAAAAAAGTPIAILADLQGPKIRLGNFADGPVTLAPGDTFVITTDESCVGTAERCSTTYGGLTGDVHAGDAVLIDDGRIALQVVGVSGNDVTTTVVVGGPVSNHKGINLPGRRGERAGHVGEGHRRPALGTGEGRRHDRPLVRALGRRRRRRPQGDGRGRRAPADRREDREAAGDREPRRHHQVLRRVHGGPRRPRRGAPARGGPARPEAHHRGGPDEREGRSSSRRRCSSR